MTRLKTKSKKVERKHRRKPRLVWVHMFPDHRNQEEAFAEHVRERGPIPKNAKVEVIVHTFRSSI